VCSVQTFQHTNLGQLVFAPSIEAAIAILLFHRDLFFKIPRLAEPAPREIRGRRMQVKILVVVDSPKWTIPFSDLADVIKKGEDHDVTVMHYEEIKNSGNTVGNILDEFDLSFEFTRMR